MRVSLTGRAGLGLGAHVKRVLVDGEEQPLTNLPGERRPLSACDATGLVPTSLIWEGKDGFIKCQDPVPCAGSHPVGA